MEKMKIILEELSNDIKAMVIKTNRPIRKTIVVFMIYPQKQ